MGDLSSEETLSDTSSKNSPEQLLQTITLKARFKNLDQIRGFVARAAENYGLEPPAVYSVQLAVDEAFTNIIEHAYGGECQEEIQCTWQVEDEGLAITMRDYGSSFNPFEVPDPDLDADLEWRQVGGLGLYFIRQLMDEVDFYFNRDAESGKRCNVLRMVKRRSEDD